MTKEVIPADLGDGGAHLNDSLKGILTELQGLTVDVVDGAGVSTNVAVTGIATEDTLVKVVNVTDWATVTFTITSAGNIRSTTDTTGKKLLVFWLNKR